ncbi:hypothetical protein LQV05_006216 [Cryptococcus neoformans]|nr:hypothetical protein LQV05_006216 [Cryptococcus neoformans]
MPGGKDGDAARTMRRELKARLAQIQDRMFEMSKYNLQVNGQNYEDFVQATEGFDEVLDRKIWGLHTEKVDHETRIAERRKKMPESINRLEVDLEMRRTEAEWLPDDLEDENEEIPKPLRHDEVRETFQTVASNLSEVVKSTLQSAPLQLQRAQRAQTVRDEITSMPL